MRKTLNARLIARGTIKIAPIDLLSSGSTMGSEFNHIRLFKYIRVK
jgi:hypothetical protein